MTNVGKTFKTISGQAFVIAVISGKWVLFWLVREGIQISIADLQCTIYFDHTIFNLLEHVNIQTAPKTKVKVKIFARSSE